MHSQTLKLKLARCGGYKLLFGVVCRCCSLVQPTTWSKVFPAHFSPTNVGPNAWVLSYPLSCLLVPNHGRGLEVQNGWGFAGLLLWMSTQPFFLVFAFVFPPSIKLSEVECGHCACPQIIGRATNIYPMHIIPTLRHMCHNFHTQI